MARLTAEKKAKQIEKATADLDKAKASAKHHEENHGKAVARVRELEAEIAWLQAAPVAGEAAPATEEIPGQTRIGEEVTE